MQWVQRVLRGNRVYARVDEKGELAADKGGRVDIVYNLKPDAKVYRAGVKNLETPSDPAANEPVTAHIDEASGAKASGAKASATKTNSSGPKGSSADGVVMVHTDGACRGNPGPMGIGVVIVDGSTRQEISEFIGHGTNNIAELGAIEAALKALIKVASARPVRIHSDSSYSIGLLQKGWKAKANQELVARIRALQSEFNDLEYIKVKGHSGVPENERCDELANEAIENQG